MRNFCPRAHHNRDSNPFTNQLGSQSSPTELSRYPNKLECETRLRYLLGCKRRFLDKDFGERKSIIIYSNCNSITVTNKVPGLHTVIGDHNRIKKIPPKTFKSNSLYLLNISNNLIKKLPKTMYKRPIALLNARYGRLMGSTHNGELVLYNSNKIAIRRGHHTIVMKLCKHIEL